MEDGGVRRQGSYGEHIPPHSPYVAPGPEAIPSSGVGGQAGTQPSGDTAAEPVWWKHNPPNDPWRGPTSETSWVHPSSAQQPYASLSPPPPAGILGGGHVVLLALVIALVAGLIGGSIGYGISSSLDEGNGKDTSLGASNGDTPALAKRPPESVAGVVERTQPSVVTIDIAAGNRAGNGSGLIISKEGHILTNNHVTATGGGEPTITVRFHDGDSKPAKLVGRDPGTDLAVIQVSEKDDVEPVQFGDSDKVRVGDPAIAFGAPLGLVETVTAGIISAVDRPVLTGGTDPGLETGGNEAYMAALQTDAPINPGNSGGPLADGAGKVIGVNTAIASLPGGAGNIGVGFAIPINQAKRIAEQIISDGQARRTVIGVRLDPRNLGSGGVRLGSVEPDSPAAKAGLREGDVITRFAGRPIEDALALVALIRKNAAGETVKVSYKRDGKTEQTSMTLVDQPVQA